MLMSKLEANFRKVIPYVPGEQPNKAGMIKINTNENPYPPAPGVQKALEGLDLNALRLYPDPTNGALVNILAEYYGLKPEQVFVGVGSDDVLATAFLTYFNSGKPIVFPDITYSFYDVYANLYQIPYEQIPLDEQFCIRAEDYHRDNGGIIIANPNAPTSIGVKLSVIEQILMQNPDVVVIVDEAYIDFADEDSALSLLNRYPNLLVVQTFSKSRSMAGMRIGYAMGSEALIKALNDVKYSINSYTMNLPSLVMGVEAVKDDLYFKRTIDMIKATRKRTISALAELGFDILPSATNFLFARHKTMEAKRIFEELKERDIYVRYFNKPRIDQYLRISIGTDEEMDIVLNAVREIMAKNA